MVRCVHHTKLAHIEPLKVKLSVSRGEMSEIVVEAPGRGGFSEVWHTFRVWNGIFITVSLFCTDWNCVTSDANENQMQISKSCIFLGNFASAIPMRLVFVHWKLLPIVHPTRHSNMLWISILNLISRYSSFKRLFRISIFHSFKGVNMQSLFLQNLNCNSNSILCYFVEYIQRLMKIVYLEIISR